MLDVVGGALGLLAERVLVAEGIEDLSCGSWEFVGKVVRLGEVGLFPAGQESLRCCWISE